MGHTTQLGSTTVALPKKRPYRSNGKARATLQLPRRKHPDMRGCPRCGGELRKAAGLLVCACGYSPQNSISSYAPTRSREIIIGVDDLPSPQLRQRERAGRELKL